MASDTNVKDPDINACDAIIAAIVAIIIPGKTNHCGIIKKNGFSLIT
ncbi:hypothetical protein SDC9_119701 [bioreactor metagenome]|uniref:Uncharacterized protein n=1 Tax=bioreactor metagenome TaxID=1076179 RepID=A0A645C594_9ZZZZ